LGLAKRGKSADEGIDDIRQNLTVEPVAPEVAANKRRRPGESSEVPGFYLNFTAGNPKDAQSVCIELTSMLLAENLKAREQVAQSTTDFLARQLDDAKRNLDDLDSKMAAFKKQYMGQLPGDEENNLKILMGLNSQLDANTQMLNRAQQDKAYAESQLAQQLTVWNSVQSSTNPESLQKQLAQLQSQLITLQDRYTDDHPDVVKTKNDIAEVKRKLKEISAASDHDDDPTQKESVSEPPEIRQLRLQMHQNGDAIAQASRDQKRLQHDIQIYQG